MSGGFAGPERAVAARELCSLARRYQVREPQTKRTKPHSPYSLRERESVCVCVCGRMAGRAEEGEEVRAQFWWETTSKQQLQDAAAHAQAQ
eukprot:3711273-Rhodomonas_salina.1